MRLRVSGVATVVMVYALPSPRARLTALGLLVDGPLGCQFWPERVAGVWTWAWCSVCFAAVDAGHGVPLALSIASAISYAAFAIASGV